jgi:hypothetical protein
MGLLALVLWPLFVYRRDPYLDLSALFRRLLGRRG